MASPQEETAQGLRKSKVLVSDSSRTGISWQEILAVVFGILGGGVYCIFTKQPASKKGIVFLASFLLWFAISALPSYEQASESESSPSQAESNSASTSTPSPAITDATPYSTAPSSQSEVTTDCSYGVCTRTHASPNGDTDIYSTGYGESYDVHSRSYESDGRTTVESWDSEGNSYSVNSSCDSTGCHSSDSEGNRCSILSDGTIIGCN